MFHNNADTHISSLAYLCYYMRGRWGYLSDTRPLNNRSFAFNSTGRRGVLCEGKRSENFTEPIVRIVCVYCKIENQTVSDHKI